MSSNLGVWSGSWGYIAVLGFLAVLSSLTVAGRFWSRRISGLGTHVDDWLALATLVVNHALNATVLIAFLRDGLGFNTKSLVEADPAAASELQKLTFIGTVLYGAGSTSIRLAVIIFFFRIFPTRAVRVSGGVLAAICILWFIAIEALNFAVCTPIAYNWDKTIEGGHCIRATPAVIIIGAVNVAIDAATVCLPIRDVVGLQLPRRKKIVVFGIFGIGGIATAASLTRLVAISFFLRFDGFNGTGTTSALLSATTVFEIYIAIVGACVPTLVPAYKRLRRKLSSPDRTALQRPYDPTGRPSKKPSHLCSGPRADTAAPRTGPYEDDARPFGLVDDVPELVPGKDRGDYWTDVSSEARPSSSQPEGIPLGTIRVQRDVTWN